MHTHSFWSIFLIFLNLGCKSFGGPAAHFIYFHKSLVIDKKYLSESDYAQLMALSHLLPGPSSSQTGLAIGMRLGGYRGAVAAWLGFTLPSALLMAAFALSLKSFPVDMQHILFQLMISVVFAIVAYAFWDMLRRYCHTVWQYLLMSISTALILWSPVANIQLWLVLGVILMGWSLAQFKTGPALVKQAASLPSPPLTGSTASTQPFHPSNKGWPWLLLFISIFIILFWLNQSHDTVLYQALYQFYASSSMVFGGGHVVLPILEQGFVATGLIDAQRFELGYAVTQLMPGPLFSFAAYIGALIPITTSPLANAAIGLLMMFLSSFLLVFASLPYWNKIMHNQKLHVILLCLNATMVGFLLAMLIPMAQKSFSGIAQFICVALMLWGLIQKKSVLWLIPSSVAISYLCSIALSYLAI